MWSAPVFDPALPGLISAAGPVAVFLSITTPALDTEPARSSGT